MKARKLMDTARTLVAADHGSYGSKEKMAGMLREAGHTVVDFGDGRPTADDDYPDFVVPMARAVVRGEIDRGVAICGSGVGACVVANKVPGVRACLIHEPVIHVWNGRVTAAARAQ